MHVPFRYISKANERIGERLHLIWVLKHCFCNSSSPLVITLCCEQIHFWRRVKIKWATKLHCTELIGRHVISQRANERTNKRTNERTNERTNQTNKQPTKTMEHSPSWEANRSSASQEIPRILWNPKVHYRVYKPTNCPYPKPDQSSPSPHPMSWRSILILSSCIRLGIPSGLLLSGLPTESLWHVITNEK
jgi:hypothetical protein